MLADLMKKIFKKRDKQIIDNVNNLAERYDIKQSVNSEAGEVYDYEKMHDIVSNTVNAIKEKIIDDNSKIETVDSDFFQNGEDEKNDTVNVDENKNKFECEDDIETLDFLDLEEANTTKDESIIEEKSLLNEDSTNIVEQCDYKDKKESNEFVSSFDDSIKSSNHNYYYIDKLLTYRQIEFMVLFVNGLSRSEISNYYNVAYDTVKKAIQEVKERLNLSEDYELIEVFKKDYSTTLRYIDILEKYRTSSSSTSEQFVNSHGEVPVKKSEDDSFDRTIYYLNDEKNNINKFAKARYIGDGTKKNNKIIVLPGSFMNKDVVITKKWLDCPWIEEARQDILLSNSVREIKNIYFFIKPFELNSPNLCACVLLGYITTDAWNEWKDERGSTLRQNVGEQAELDEKSNNEEAIENIVSEFINEEALSNDVFEDISIRNLNLSVRSKNCLFKNKIFMLSDLLLCSEEEIRKFKNLGRISYDEIIQMIKNRGLKLFTENYTKYLDYPIEKLHFSVRTVNCLNSKNIITLYDLLITKLDEIEEIPHLGDGCIDEIKKKIHGIELVKKKMDLEEGDILISDLNLSARSENCLENAGILTLYELSELSLDELFNLKNLGRKSYDEIVAKMEELGKPLKNKEITLECDNIDYPDTNYNFIKAMRLIEDVFGSNIIKNFDETQNQEFLKRLNNSLNTLKQPAKDILVARYGLITGENMTLQEIANIQNVTRERIRQSAERSLEKLRSKKHTKILRAYFIFEENNKEKDMNDIEFIMSLLK